MSKNVILVDADYIDHVAFNLIVNFERTLNRPIPQADLARWAECVALDGGLREGTHETQVVLVHSHQTKCMKNFVPNGFKALDGQAFKGPLGEFVFSTVSTEGLVADDQLFSDTLQMLAADEEVERLMVVPDEAQYRKAHELLLKAGNKKTVTLFAMQPAPGGRVAQEILGYSLLSALGIKADEIERELSK